MRLLWVCLLAISCGPHGTSSHPARKPVACKDRVARLGNRLGALVLTTPGAVPHVRGLRSLDSAHGQPIDARGSVLAVTRDGSVVVSGNWLDTVQAGRDYISAVEKKGVEDALREQGPPPPWPLYIWPDRDAPIPVIADLVAGLSDHWRPRLLVGGGVAVAASDRELLEQPSVRATAATLPGVEPDATTFIARELRTALAGCTPVFEVFVRSQKEEARAADMLAKDVAPALGACDCRAADADVFEWGMLATFGAYEPPLRWIAIPKLARRDRRTIGQIVN